MCAYNYIVNDDDNNYDDMTVNLTINYITKELN
jgi:hypothetical protein